MARRAKGPMTSQPRARTRFARTPPWVSIPTTPKPCKGGAFLSRPYRALASILPGPQGGARCTSLALSWLVSAPLVRLHTAIGNKQDRPNYIPHSLSSIRFNRDWWRPACCDAERSMWNIWKGAGLSLIHISEPTRPY